MSGRKVAAMGSQIPRSGWSSRPADNPTPACMPTTDTTMPTDTLRQAHQEHGSM
jgi:hypothetical protein